ncbi:hypothetical protein LguiB_017642 [Lonicera macranthoides]
MATINLSTLILFSCLIFTATAIRPNKDMIKARLDNEGGMMECWDSLMELKSCTNEIILFFINGESYLGMECCRAIRVIMSHCWPSMLTSVGYTSEEGDILRDYCGSDGVAPPPFHIVELAEQSPARSPLVAV